MRDHRPVLLGINNPLSSRPEHALFPYPAGCTGWRIWQMLREKADVSRTQYLRAFDRRNWDDQNQETFVREMRGREVVVLGEQARAGLGIPRLLIHPQVVDGVTWRQLPHPSGRNRWYNDEANRAVAAALLYELYSTVRIPEYS